MRTQTVSEKVETWTCRGRDITLSIAWREGEGGERERERTPKLYFTRRGGERVGEERERGGEGGRGA